MFRNRLSIFVLVLALICQAFAVPMLYEKRLDGKFEAGMFLQKVLHKLNHESIDLIAVSSTVIPLSVLEVTYGKNGKPTEEYKMAYLKKLMKKIKHQDTEDDINPDTLITSKSSEFPLLETSILCIFLQLRARANTSKAKAK